MKNTVSIILIRNNNYVLQHRDNKDFIADPGTYGAWGGSVEDQDVSIEAAALRELAEETGLIIKKAQLINLGSELRDGRAPANKGKHVNFYYFALNIKSNIAFSAREGQGIIELPIPYVPNEKMNDIAIAAIKKYESQFIK